MKVRYPGLGEYRVVCLKESAPELLSRVVDTPEAAFHYWQAYVAKDERFNPEQESMVCIMLNTRRRPLGHVNLSQGTKDTLLVHPGEVFRAAVIASAAAIILIHNHPSGDPTPSEADIKVTRDLIRAGQLLKTDVLDHVVVGSFKLPQMDRQWCSLRELGYFYS
jgi:DNA repair protein RadC